MGYGESILNVKKRADDFKDQIFDYTKFKRDLYGKNSKISPKIAVVSHSMFLKIITSRDEYWESQFVEKPEER